MNKQELEKTLLSEVNSQPFTTAHVASNSLHPSTQSALETANRLLNEAKDANTAIDLTQQTLIDVNSQPLISGLLAAHSVFGQQSPSQHSINDTTSSSALNDQLSSALLHHSHPLTELSSANTSITVPPATSSAATDNDASLESYDNDNNSYPGEMITDPNDPLITEFETRFAVGRVFESLEELRGAVFEYGKKHNVALTTSKSDKSKVYLLCKHGGKQRKGSKKPSTSTAEEAAALSATAAASATGGAAAAVGGGDKKSKARVRPSQKTGCECMIYARKCKDQLWMIKKSIPHHNHPIASDPTMYPMYRSFPPEYLLVVQKLLLEHVSVSHIVKSLRANGLSNIVPKDICNIQQDLKKRGLLGNAPNKSGGASTVLNDFPSTLAQITAAAAAATSTSPSTNSVHQFPFHQFNAENSIDDHLNVSIQQADTSPANNANLKHEE